MRSTIFQTSTNINTEKSTTTTPHLLPTSLPTRQLVFYTTKMANVLRVCVVIYNVLYAKVAYSEDVSLLVESMNNINKGTEVQLDTRKDINLENKERIQIDVPKPDEKKCVNTKNLVCYSTVNNAQFLITLGNSHVH
jgi:hypothetical protein